MATVSQFALGKIKELREKLFDVQGQLALAHTILRSKERKIKELEKKVARLERLLQER